MAIKEIVTVAPRGFCAGVARSIKVVEDCLEIFGAPVYIKHAIVHNKTVVADLEAKGAITVESVSDIPDGAVAVFSAHGSPPEHFAQARARGIRFIDATCPLVTKVHMEMIKFLKEKYHVIYVGHKGHVEGLGVIGEAEKFGKSIPVVETVEDVQALEYGTEEKIAFLTQTTLSIDETEAIINALKKKFPHIVGPPAKDICYATTNRQEAIRALAKEVDVIFVVGSKTSSNSNRLVEVAKTSGCDTYLIDTVEEIQSEWIKDAERVGISAGASAPEYKVQEIITTFTKKGVAHRLLTVTEENMQFTEPIELMRVRKEHTE
ncbi:MAG: 4-hydroxy-3-methylbut-2-enyl diphosphate reductase [Candidatus Moraniibacteriota bacterium]|nr:MAG: 4-hydroxy-3-methylbut-2-enyl diphosphate reductase [Candidatus Moranbacteria bacterium]